MDEAAPSTPASLPPEGPPPPDEPLPPTALSSDADPPSAADPPPTARDTGLNPAQARTLAELGAGATDRPAFPADLGDELRTALEEGLAEVAAELRDDRPLRVDKYLLAGVHGCEVRFRNEEGAPFTPSVPVVRGTIVHKALELAVHWRGTPIPLHLVDEAIGRVADSDHWAADWLATRSEVEHAELRAAAGDVVAKFLECWPPLDPAMRPATEVRMRADLAKGRIVLNGRVDLTLGQPIGSGTQARKIVVDFKTGGASPAHREDLRFYALIETLRLGVPPRLLVSAYLDAGHNDVEAVTEGHLRAAAARTIDGVRRYAALRTGEAAPQYRPSFACRWCALLDDCETGQTFLADNDPFG